jgi:hypothetical protein
MEMDNPFAQVSSLVAERRFLPVLMAREVLALGWRTGFHLSPVCFGRLDCSLECQKYGK